MGRCLEQEITCREEAEGITAINTHRQVQYLRKVAEFWQDIHVAKTIDGNYRALSRGLLNVQQRVPELIAIGMKKIYRA